MSPGGTARYRTATHVPPLVVRAAVLAYDLGFDDACLPEQGRLLREAIEAAAALSAEGMVMVPKEPSIGRLVSMAIRSDHGLGVPGYYDQVLFQNEGLTHAKRMEVAIRDMRQLYEEATGRGFYNDGREDEYKAMLAAAKGERDEYGV